MLVESILRKLRNAQPSDFARIGIIAMLVMGIAGFYVYQELMPESEIVLQEDPGVDDDGKVLATRPDIVVHVTGAVQAAGVYHLEEGHRVMDAIEAAGGFTDDAASESLNLARVLTDGEQIVVPSVDDHAQEGSSKQESNTPEKININNASVTQLQELAGIGPSIAKRIVEYREKYGPFAKTEDLKKVSGIGDKKFAAIEGEICV